MNCLYDDQNEYDMDEKENIQIYHMFVSLTHSFKIYIFKEVYNSKQSKKK